MPQLSPEGRRDPSPPPGKTLFIPSKSLAAYLKAHFTEQNTEIQGFQTPLWLSGSFPPVYSFNKHLFEHTVCSQLQTETGKPVMLVGTGPPNREDKASVSFLPPPPVAHYVPSQSPLPPLGEPLTFTDKTQALRSCLLEWLWWGRASGRASRRRRPRPGKQGSTSQALLPDWAKTQSLGELGAGEWVTRVE